MKNRQILFLAAAFLVLTAVLVACDQSDTQPDPVETVKPDFVELMDLDGDGRPELVLGFPKDELLHLPPGEVVLEGIFSGTDTRITTESFSIAP